MVSGIYSLLPLGDWDNPVMTAEAGGEGLQYLSSDSLQEKLTFRMGQCFWCESIKCTCEIQANWYEASRRIYFHPFEVGTSKKECSFLSVLGPMQGLAPSASQLPGERNQQILFFLTFYCEAGSRVCVAHVCA